MNAVQNRNFRAWTFSVLIAAMSSSFLFADEPPPSAVGPLMKLYQSGKLPAEREGAVVEMICNRGNEHDLRVIFDRLVDPAGFPAELRQKTLGWLTDAAVTRKVIPAGDLAKLSSSVVGPEAAKNPAFQRQAIQLAAACKLTSVTPALQQLATDPKTPAALQRAALDGLISIGGPASEATLKKLAAAGSPWPVRVRAVAGMVAFDPAAAAIAAAEVLKETPAKADPGPMLDAFFQHKAGVDGLAAAIEKSPPSVDVAKVTLRYMYSVGRSDHSLSSVLGKIAGIAEDPAPPTPEEVAKLADEVIAKGNAARGEQIFRRKDLSCMKCHSVSRAGGQIGPELSAVGGSSPVDYIVNSILNPNLAVKEQYVTKVFALDSGKVLTGVVIDRDDVRVNLRDVTGTTITIPTADIEEETEGKSLMPQGLTKFLTREELIDLARFVSELGKPGAYALNQRKTVQRWRMLAAPGPELTAEVPHLEHLRQFVLGSAPSDWLPVYSQVNGTLPLAELRPAEGPAVLILKGEFDLRTAGRVVAKIRCTEKFQAWLNTETGDPAQPLSAELPPGRHPVILRIELSDRAQPELEVELSAPADSSAKFELVGGT